MQLFKHLNSICKYYRECKHCTLYNEQAVQSAVLPPSLFNKDVEEDCDVNVDNDNQGKGGGRHSDRKDGQQHIYESQ